MAVRCQCGIRAVSVRFPTGFPPSPKTPALIATISPSLDGIVHHSDGTREVACNRDSHIGQLARGLDHGPGLGWVRIDMAKNWSDICSGTHRSGHTVMRMICAWNVHDLCIPLSGLFCHPTARFFATHSAAASPAQRPVARHPVIR